MKFKDLFAIEKKPKKGLFAAEWVILGYLVLTTLFIFFAYVKLPNPESMLWGRFHVVAMTAAMWLVYRLIPCRLTRFARIATQLLLLSWWYPDTYELNRILPNLDHLAAGTEQWIFGCQPSWLFSQKCPWFAFSELMNMGYTAYFPMIATVTMFYFFFRYDQFMRATFVILASFYAYYVLFVFLPVTGPQYYYPAVGVEQIAAGVFPPLHDYFMTMREALPTPGNPDGLFYQMVVDAHAAGERPTAAFPSSHVGVSTVLMLLAWQTRNRRLFWILMFFYVVLCLSTVYIYAHYAIDVIAGWISALLLFPVLYYAYKRFARE